MNEQAPTQTTVEQSPAPEQEPTKADAYRDQAIAENRAAQGYTVDASGHVLTPSEQENELQYRQEHGGQPSNESPNR